MNGESGMSHFYIGIKKKSDVSFWFVRWMVFSNLLSLTLQQNYPGYLMLAWCQYLTLGQGMGNYYDFKFQISDPTRPLWKYGWI